MRYLILTLCIFVFANIHGQKITVNKGQTTIPNYENRKIAVYFNYNSLPKNFSVFEDSILTIYSRLARYNVQQITKEELRTIQKTNSEHYFIFKIDKVTLQWKSRIHANNKSRKLSYYSFSLLLPERNSKIALFNSTNSHLSSVDFYSSFYVLTCLADAISKGYTWKSYNSYIHENSSGIENRDLYIVDNYSNISAIKQLKLVPKRIIIISQKELTAKLISKSDNFVYTYVCPHKGSIRKCYETLIIDNGAKKIINAFQWENRLE